jgi:hypothetical protein
MPLERIDLSTATVRPRICSTAMSTNLPAAIDTGTMIP